MFGDDSREHDAVSQICSVELGRCFGLDGIDQRAASLLGRAREDGHDERFEDPDEEGGALFDTFLAYCVGVAQSGSHVADDDGGFL